MNKLREDVFLPLEKNIEIGEAATLVENELRWAIANHRPFASAHEAFAIMKEECDELWEQVRKDDIEHARREAIQCAAMCLRFLIDVK